MHKVFQRGKCGGKYKSTVLWLFYINSENEVFRWSALSFLIFLPSWGKRGVNEWLFLLSCQHGLTHYSDYVSSWIFNSWTIVERFKVTLSYIKIFILTKLRIIERNLAMHMYCTCTPRFLYAYFAKIITHYWIHILCWEKFLAWKIPCSLGQNQAEFREECSPAPRRWMPPWTSRCLKYCYDCHFSLSTEEWIGGFCG